MVDWDHNFNPPPDRRRDPIKADKLANVLEREGGDRYLKLRWLIKNMAILEGLAVASGKTDRALQGEMVSLAISRYRFFIKKRKQAAVEKPQMKGARGKEPDTLNEILEQLEMIKK